MQGRQSNRKAGYPSFFKKHVVPLKSVAPIAGHRQYDVLSDYMFEFADLDPWKDAQSNATRLATETIDRELEAGTPSLIVQAAGKYYELASFEAPYNVKGKGKVVGINTVSFESEFEGLLLVQF